MSDSARCSREVAAGRAMLQAGNLTAAIRHCKAALEAVPGSRHAYDLQFDILTDKGRSEEALRVTQKRLEQHPRCKDATLNEIAMLAAMMRVGLAKKAVARARVNFADDPMMQHDIHLVFDATLDQHKAVRRRIKTLRQGDYTGHYDLDALERRVVRKTGSLRRVDAMLAGELAEGRIDASRLEERALLSIKRLRLLSARRLARQAMDLEPERAPVHREVRNAATAGFIPLLWPAYLFAFVDENIGSKLPAILRIFTLIAAMATVIIVLMAVTVPLMVMFSIGYDLGDDDLRVLIPMASVVFLNMGWAWYVRDGIGAFSRWRLRENTIALDPDY